MAGFAGSFPGKHDPGLFHNVAVLDLIGLDVIDSAESKRGATCTAVGWQGLERHYSSIRRTLDASPDGGGWEGPIPPLVKKVQFPHGRSWLSLGEKGPGTDWTGRPG